MTKAKLANFSRRVGLLSYPRSKEERNPWGRYVKRGKSGAVDAEAIWEAVTRPTMRFVEITSVEQQAALSLHRARDLIVRQRTQLINMLRSLLAEFGVSIARGLARAISYAQGLLDGEHLDLPEVARDVIHNLCQQLAALHLRVRWCEMRLRLEAKRDGSGLI